MEITIEIITIIMIIMKMIIMIMMSIIVSIIIKNSAGTHLLHLLLRLDPPGGYNIIIGEFKKTVRRIFYPLKVLIRHELNSVSKGNVHQKSGSRIAQIGAK